MWTFHPVARNATIHISYPKKVFKGLKNLLETCLYEFIIQIRPLPILPLPSCVKTLQITFIIGMLYLLVFVLKFQKHSKGIPEIMALGKENLPNTGADLHNWAGIIIG